MKRAATITFMVLCLLPLAAGLGYALLYSLGLVGLISKGFTLAHWQAVLGNAQTWVSLGYSMAVALVTVTLSAGLALGATLVYRQGRFSPTRWFVPLCIPQIVAAFFSFLALSDAGIASRLAHALGLITDPAQFPSLVFDSWGMGIIATHVLLTFPFFTLFMVHQYQKEGVSQLEALAHTLGASPWQATLKVTAPLLLRRALPLLVMYSIFVFGAYEVPLVLGSQYPKMISLTIIDQMRRFNLGTVPLGYTLAVLYTVLVLTVAVLVLRKHKLVYAG